MYMFVLHGIPTGANQQQVIDFDLGIVDARFVSVWVATAIVFVNLRRAPTKGICDVIFEYATRYLFNARAAQVALAADFFLRGVVCCRPARVVVPPECTPYATRLQSFLKPGANF